MRVRVDPDGGAVVEFDGADELGAVYASDISAGGIRLPTDVALPLFTDLRLTLRLVGGGEAVVAATVVNHLPGAVAVAFTTPPAVIRAALEATGEPATEAASGDPRERDPGLWERVRGLSRNDKLLLAPKASRAERAVLEQDRDGQVLYFLLKNPRITTEEVARIARSSQLTGPTADLIARSTQWCTNVDVRVSLVNNPKTPSPLALRLLPTLPEPEVRRIAKSTAVSQSIRQAALRIVVNLS